MPSWERRDALGVFPALISTLRELLWRPAETFRAMPKDGGVLGPLLYAVLMGVAGKAFFALMLLKHPYSRFFENCVFIGSALTIAPALQIAYIAVLTAPPWVALKVVYGGRIQYRCVFRIQCYAFGTATLCLFAVFMGGAAMMDSHFILGLLIPLSLVGAALLYWILGAGGFIVTLGCDTTAALFAHFYAVLGFIGIYLYRTPWGSITGVDFYILRAVSEFLRGLS